MSPVHKLAIALVVLMCFTASRAGAARDSMPPGVSAEEFKLPGLLSSAYSAGCLTVDWTEPLLRAEFVEGLREGLAPRLWEEALRDNGGWTVALAEPVERGGEWSLATPLLTPAPEGRRPEPAALEALEKDWERYARLPHFYLSRDWPWLPGGGRIGDETFSLLPAPAPDPRTAGLAAVRWMGPAAELDSLPEYEFRNQLILSISNPGRGTTRFVKVSRETAGPGYLAELVPWLKTLCVPDDWTAIHAMGPDALIQAPGDGPLAPPAGGAHKARLGGALVLRGAEPGDPVDLARLRGARLFVNAWERDFDAGRAADGVLWAASFDPALWQTPVKMPHGKTAEIKLKFTSPQRAGRLRLVWASAMGFSRQFNPALARVTIGEGASGRAGETREISGAGADEWILDFPQSVDVLWVLVEFVEPTGEGGDGRARLSAFELTGPWDGVTPRR